MRANRESVGQNESEDPKEDSVFFTLMKKVGDTGRYQMITFTTLCIIGYMVGGLSLMTPFLFY
jgi:hypothetical protein